MYISRQPLEEQLHEQPLTDHSVIEFTETDVSPVLPRWVACRDPAARGSCTEVERNRNISFRSTDKGVNHRFSRARDTANITTFFDMLNINKPTRLYSDTQ